ncbi:thymidine kinase [Candidatus Woesearchaeota archaeon CG10_big_fil_rev_8_21_14_0_10_32_9]|nr:MAG: thymidine kinase [Candidatus Woesearchaeota archaeon CG10_big_fil_rev_8_21_14_0_10_32_9]
MISENNMNYNPNIKPGILEIFAGPMFSGKTQGLIHRVQKIEYMDNVGVEFFKPGADTRNQGYIFSRGTNIKYACKTIPADEPERIFDYVKDTQVVGIDEAQFFSKRLVRVAEELLKANLNLIISGLDLDYRAEPFGPMPDLMAIANDVEKYSGICMVCRKNPGTRTQLILNGKPAPYDLESNVLPQDLSDESIIKYEVRCIQHHEVPGKP